jgi:hypothetical protein
MFDKYIYEFLNFVYHWSTKLTSWSWCKLYSDRKKGYGYRKKNKILKLKTLKQHYVNSLVNYDKYDNIVEQLIKEKLGHGNGRRQKDSQDSKKSESK